MTYKQSNTPIINYMKKFVTCVVELTHREHFSRSFFIVHHCHTFLGQFFHLETEPLQNRQLYTYYFIFFASLTENRGHLVSSSVLIQGTCFVSLNYYYSLKLDPFFYFTGYLFTYQYTKSGYITRILSFKSYFNGLKFNIGPYVKINKIIVLKMQTCLNSNCV